MNLRDFMLDVTDIFGRILSGAIILLNLLLVSNFVFGWNIQFQTAYTYFKEASGIMTLSFLAVAYILGECSLFVSFWALQFLKKKGVLLRETGTLEAVASFDRTSDQRILNFFKGEFNLEQPDDEITKPTYKNIQAYCKESLVQVAPLAHTHARKFEGRINFYAGMMVASLISFITVMVYFSIPYKVGVGILLLAVFYTSFKRYRSMLIFSEPMLIYLSYYLAFTSEASRDHQTEDPPNKRMQPTPLSRPAIGGAFTFAVGFLVGLVISRRRRG